MLPPKVMGLHTLYVFILFYEQPPLVCLHKWGQTQAGVSLLLYGLLVSL